MRPTTILTVVLLLLNTVAMAATEKTAPKQDPKPAVERETEEVPTFTTEDLERKYGPSSKPAPAADAASSTQADPLQQLLARQEAGREESARKEEARTRVTAAETIVRELEKKQARLRNPLLGAVVPDAGDEQAWRTADQAGRLRIIEESLAAARTELEQARKDLGRLHASPSAR